MRGQASTAILIVAPMMMIATSAIAHGNTFGPVFVSSLSMTAAWLYSWNASAFTFIA